MIRFIKAFLLFAFVTFSVTAQKRYSTAKPSAIRNFEEAKSRYDLREDDKALQFLAKAIEEDSLFVEAYLLRANIYTDRKQPEKAIEDYRTSIRISPDFYLNTYFTLGKLEFLNRQYEASYEHLSTFVNSPKANSSMAGNAKRIMSSCRFAQQAMGNPVKFDPKNMGAGINTADLEYFPAITADGATFLFTRRPLNVPAGNKAADQEDFYVSTKSGEVWQQAKPLTEINTMGNEGAPSLAADGQYLFFTACEERLSTGSRPTKGSCDIFITKKIGDKYGPARNLEEPVNTGIWESQPSFSSDGRTLYFVRAIKGADGKTQQDIYVTRINDNSSWSDPVPLASNINTPYNESSVFIHPDDQTMYFSSDGHPGLGGLDIFVVRKLPTGEWGQPLNLGYPINTSADENSLLVSPDGTTGFFASDRPGGFGGLDIYKFELDEALRPLLVSYMKGKVYDAETKQPFSANFTLIDLEKDTPVVRSTSNSVTGGYLVCLPTGKRYALNVQKDGYLFYSENFELSDPKKANEPVIRDVPLQPIKVGESITLKNIFFEFNKYDLKPESFIELNRLVKLMNKNPKLTAEISGHTDNVGGKEYNRQLSEKRAAAVKQYLTDHGISAVRLQSVGYGDTKPIKSNDTESGRAENRRTEFKVVSMD